MNRLFHTARRTAVTAPLGRLAAGAVLLLAAAGTVGAAQGMNPHADRSPAGVGADHHRGTSVRAADDPWTVAHKVVQRDDPWTSAPATPLRDDPWT
ncbi:hypothetical protein ACFZCP_43305 [Streptomyces sp. NPDC007971]|uniref:hypothetical protein n=1 Tax=unclassified Streptomyces TaxID=2593676 RepID=UPI003432070C